MYVLVCLPGPKSPDLMEVYASKSYDELRTFIGPQLTHNTLREHNRRVGPAGTAYVIAHAKDVP